MYLLDHDSKNCLFKILPRYKVRSVGDEVSKYVVIIYIYIYIYIYYIVCFIQFLRIFYIYGKN